MKYLGLVVDDKREIYGTHRKAVVSRAKWRGRETCSAIERSYNRVLVGKTIWKDVELPGLLFGSGIYSFSKQQERALQTIENMVYRAMLRGPSYVAAETLRGEIGASSMESRLMKSRLLLAKSFRESDNGLVREIMERVERDNKNLWNIDLKRCMEKTGIDSDSLSTMSKEQVRDRVLEFDTDEWRRSMETKSSLYIYIEGTRWG